MRSYDVVTDYQYLTRVFLFGIITDGYKNFGEYSEHNGAKL